MPITGGGNPLGSGGTAGIGKGLNYTLNRAYAYSGNVLAVNGTDGTLFDFTTGSDLILLDMWWSWDYEAMGDASDFGVTLTINGDTVIDEEQSTRASGGRVVMQIFRQQLLLAPYTRFVMTNTTTTGAPGVTCAMTLNGVLIT